MDFNVSQTKVVNFDLRGFDQPRPIIFLEHNCIILDSNFQIVEKIDSFKYLRVILDENLSWETYKRGK